MSEAIIAEFKNSNPNKFLEHKILESVPFVFNNDFNQYLYWKSVLSRNIEVDSRSFVIVGSASIGFSLNPSKNFKLFDSESDIDVAIISQFYFDVAWRKIRNLGSLYHSQPPTIQASIKEHKERFIYWGTIATDKILPILPFSKEWNNAKKEMREINPTKNRDVNFRIYKDFESLRSYQITGIKAAQNKILETNDV